MQEGTQLYIEVYKLIRVFIDTIKIIYHLNLWSCFEPDGVASLV